MSADVIRPFDPWRKGSLCTCPFKYTVNVYTGCGHQCVYCYITSYIRDAFNPRPKKDFIRRVIKDLRNIPKGSVINISSSSDPYTYPEEKYRITREFLRIIIKDYLVEIITKSSLVVRDIDILSIGKVFVSMTITTLDRRLASIMEPKAPEPDKRIEALAILSKAKIPTVLRLDPILPFINDSEKSIRKVILQASSVGVRHIIASTYKAKPDNLARVLKTFPDLTIKYKHLYLTEGSRIHGAYYLPQKLRLEILKKVRDITHEYGLTFSTCREGFSFLNDKDTYCDGSHLIRRRIGEK